MASLVARVTALAQAVAADIKALSLLGLGNSADLRGNAYEKGAPNTVANKGLVMGLARGGTDGLSIPAFGTTTNQYGTLLVMAGYNDLSGGPAYNRMFIRGGRMWIQPYSTTTSWGAWTELYSPLNVDAVPYITPTLLNSWSAQQGVTRRVGYRIICGMVELQLNVNPGTLSTNKGNASGVMILPAGYRPAVELIVPCGANQNIDISARGGVPRAVISPDGTVSSFSHASNENITVSAFFKAG